MAAKKKITIETLALMVQNGFSEMSEKLDQKPDRTELDLKADKTDIDRVLARVAAIGNNTNDYRANQLSMKIQIDRHEVRITKLEKKTG